MGNAGSLHLSGNSRGGGPAGVVESSEIPSVSAVMESEHPSSSVPQSHPETSDNRIPKSSSQADSAKKSDTFIDKALTLPKALANEPFGAYMLSEAPAGFQVENIRLYQDENSYFLSGLWTKGYHSLSWQVQPYRQEYAGRETSVADTQNYDLSLYPIPRADSVPRDLWEIVDNPIFDAKELTLETVYARSYQIDDAGDSEGWRMEFSVRYGDILVQIHAKGLTPEWIYSQLEQLLDSPSE